MENNLSIVDHVYIVTQPFQVRRDVGADQDAPIFILFHVFPQQIQYALARHHVKPCGWFIHEKEISAVGNRCQHFQLRLHSRGKFFDIFILRNALLPAKVKKSRPVKRRVQGLQHRHHVLYLQITAEPGFRQSNSDLLLLRSGEFCRCFSHQGNVSLVVCDKSQRSLERSALPGAVLAHQPGDAPRLHLHRTVQCKIPVMFYQTIDLKHLLVLHNQIK